MPNPALSATVACVRRVALAPATPVAADADLLGRFVATRDGDAFAALVDRHGPMVLAVCRRVAGDPHLAEDAFQAAFLVLARRAAVVRPRATVRGWLYGVAVRTARHAHAGLARRRAREASMPHVPDRPAPEATAPDQDALGVLDEEIARLPESLRAAVVLCELDGLSRKVAATQLGVPEGTLSSRLAKARKVLGDRVRGRGVTLGAVAATTAVGVPSTLAAATARLATPGPVSAAVADLSRKVIRTMFLTRLKLTTAGLVVAFVCCASAGTLSRPVRADDPPRPVVKDTPAEKPAARAGVPKVVGPGRILFNRDGELFLIDPDGKNERPVALPPEAAAVTCLSPDGRQLAFWTGDDKEAKPAVCVRDLDGQGLGTRIELGEKCGYIHFFWTADGKSLYVDLGGPTDPTVRHLRVDVKEKKITRLDGLKHHLVADLTRDGKHFLATAVGDGADWQPKSVHLMNPDGTEHQALITPKGWAAAGRLSPDGKRAICTVDGKPAVVDLGKPGVFTTVEGIPDGTEVVETVWSPDGKRIAYTTGTSRPLDPEDLKKLESRLVVADPDGKNAKVIISTTGHLILGVDWR